MNDTIWILARSYAAAKASAIDLGLPHYPGRWKWVADERQLRGMRKIRVHYGHDWTEHRDAQALQYHIERMSDVVVV